MNNGSLNKSKTIKINDLKSNILTSSIKKVITFKDKENIDSYSLSVFNGTISSKINNGSGFINDLSVSNIGHKYKMYLKNKNIKDKKILVISDNNFDATVFSQIFASALKVDNIDVFFSTNNEPTNSSVGISQIDESFGGMVSFSIINDKENVLLISFFDVTGMLLSSDESVLFNNDFLETGELNLEVYNEKISTFKSLNIEKYFSTLPTPKDLSNIKVSINNSYEMNKKIISNFFSRNKIVFNESKTKNPNANKNIKKATLNSVRKKDDVALSLSTDNNYFELTILHKNQYKFLDLNELSAIYLYFLLKYSEYDKTYFMDKYIITSIGSSDLSSIIAKRHSINVDTYEDLQSTFSNNNFSKEKMLFATNGINYFISSQQKSYLSDPFYNLQLILEMISFFKKQNKTLYDIMEEITAEYGVYRYSTINQNMDDVTTKKLFNIIAKEMQFVDQKIIRYDKINVINKDKKIIKITLEDKTKITFIYSLKLNLLKLNISLYFKTKKAIISADKKSINSSNENYIDLVVKEKKIVEYIKIFKDDHTKKTTSWKDFLKYFIFISILIGIFVILFTTLYNIDGNGVGTTFEDLNKLITSSPLLKYLLPLLVLGISFPIICNSILIGRMLKVQGQKVKIRYLITSSIIGIVISNITPLSIGGDLAGYWYLRRKSFERGSLIATYLASSFLYQITGAITSSIFVPIGFVVFNDVLNFSQPHTILIFILVLIGFVGNIIGAIFIGVFSLSRRAQNSFVNVWMRLFDWVPFIISRDPKSKAANFQYEFTKIRNSSLMIFKKPFSTIEFIFWRMLPFFFNLGAILAILTGKMKPNNELWGGQYINFMIATSTLNAANAISFTPGGSGTAQVLQTIIFDGMFIGGVTDGGSIIPPKYWSTIFSLLSTIIFFIVPTVVSALLLFTVWLGEKRIDKYSKVKRIIQYEAEEKRNKGIRKYTRFYKISFIIWIVICISILSVYYGLI